MRTFDPEIYLVNSVREVLGLTGASTQPQSIVQAAQEGYFTATGRWIYVDGMPNAAAVPTAKVAPLPQLDLSGADDLMKFTIAQLKDIAAMNGIDVAGLPRNKQLLADYIAANMNLKGNA